MLGLYVAEFMSWTIGNLMSLWVYGVISWWVGKLWWRPCQSPTCTNRTHKKQENNTYENPYTRWGRTRAYKTKACC